MTKVRVRLKHAANRFQDDNGKQFPPNKTVEIEATQRIQDAIAVGLLEKVPGKEKLEADDAPDDTPAIAATPAKADEKK